MRKSKSSKSEGDEHVQSEGGGSGNLQQVSKYEMQRLKRIEENKKRMEDLGLRKIATSFMGSVHKAQTNNNEKKGKRKMDDEDDEYAPSQDDERISSSSEDNESDEEFSISQKKVTKKATAPKKRGTIQKTVPSSDFVEDDDDEALMQAIALSLQDTTNPTSDKRKELPRSLNDSRTMKRKKPMGGRVKMTEDEMLIHFFQFDETGKGGFTVRDVQRLAVAHDFTWSEKELADMIYCFDTDGDGKINYDDFCKIIGRCNMLKGSDGENG